MGLAVLFALLVPLLALALIVIAVVLAALAVDHIAATWVLGLSAALLLYTFFGRYLVLLFRPQSANEPTRRVTVRAHTLTTRDKAPLFVDSVGVKEQFSLLFCHGVGLTSDIWSYLVRSRRLERLGRITTFDLRGAGRSQLPQKVEYSLDVLARDLRDVLESEAARKVVLVGQGLGCLVVLNYCRLFSNQVGRRVTGLILISPPLRALTTSPRVLSLAVALSPLVSLLNRLAYWSGLAHIAAALSSFTGRETRGQLDLIARTATTTPPRVSQLEVHAMVGFDAQATLKQVEIPVLIIGGDKDRNLPVADLEAFAKGSTNTTVAIVPNTGPLSFLERSVEFEHQMYDWIEAMPNGPVGRRGQRRQLTSTSEDDDE